MNHADWLAAQAHKSLIRLLPHIELLLPEDAQARAVFLSRLEREFPRLFALLYGLYADQYDFFYHLESILTTAAQLYTARPAELKALDAQREADPQWFQGQQMVGGVYYVDLLAGTLAGVRERIPYFKELGLTYLHLMPLFSSPDGPNDGGYAVSNYREVNPALGSMDDLRALAAELRENGISLVLDFVFNHTANDHPWALKSLAGEEAYQDFYFIFPDRALPDQYERNLREIFPEQAPGSFTYQPEADKWVWTTFNHFQWDLNYRNPAVFNAMLGEMLFLANQGVEVLRLDAVAFIWKQMGTSCEGLPQVHQIIRAYNALLRIVTPAMLFKSEAIVHPDEVASYIQWEECPISYNPTMMALTWEALATREVRLLRDSMIKRFALPQGCAWVNYMRCHDDIGWTFADEDAVQLGINGFDHRQFLNAFYVGSFPGSFSVGLPFNFNPLNLDMRICGTAASLAGLEQALAQDNALYQEHAVRRILLIHSIILSTGGIPLIYLGDELGTLNDYSFRNDPAKANDNRWVHRPRFDWDRAAQRQDVLTLPGRIFQRLQQMITVRKNTSAFANGHSQFFDTGNPHVLGYTRHDTVLALMNFSEFDQAVSHNILAQHWQIPPDVVNLLYGQAVTIGETLTLPPYTFLWLGAASTGNSANH